MNLLQEKIDVLTKKRSNLFNWRGQFTPEFVEYILQVFTKEGYFIIDPFSGSGTVLQEAARLNLKVAGIEINPAAYAMSKFFTFCNLSYSDRQEYCHIFMTKINKNTKYLNGERVYIDNEDYRMAYANLINFAMNMNEILDDKQERILLLNMLFQSEKDKKLTLKESIFKSFDYIVSAFNNLPYTEIPVNVLLNDSRSTGVEFTGADLIFTSPPYINVFNYHQNYRAIIEIFNFDILKVANSEFGSNRKNRGNRFKTVIQYCLDMELAMRSFWQALKNNAKLILVLGKESNVRGTPFYNGQMIVDILEKLNGFTDIQTTERQFINKYGNSIKEDIIIATKKNNLSTISYARVIAQKHLEESFLTSQKNVRDDILDAIGSIDNVMPSPIFNARNVIKNEQYTT